MGETSVSNIYQEVKEYLIGKGLDIGSGGDKITDETWGFDLPIPYSNVGNKSIEMRGDAFGELPFNDCVLDYIYSSHLLEDSGYDLINHVLKEWLRVIKSGGYLILYLPDQKLYLEHCKETNQTPNGNHQIEIMSLNYMENLVREYDVEIVKSIPKHWAYSFLIVLRKL